MTKPTKFSITKDIKDRIRLIVPEKTTVLEIKRQSTNIIMIYAVWNGIRIAEAKYPLKIGNSVYLNDVEFTIDFET